MAERAPPSVVAPLLRTLDGPEGRSDALLIALDESTDDEPGVAAALLERLAFLIPVPTRVDEADPRVPAQRVAAARLQLDAVEVSTETREILCRTALALGVGSSRAEIFALRAARASAALAGRRQVEEADLILAVELVLSPRATRLPAEEPEPQPEPPPPEPTNTDEGNPSSIDQVEDRVLAAARAALPPQLLARLGNLKSGGASGRGSSGAKVLTHGRRVGSSPGDPRRGARLDLVETLRAAAPWQRVRPHRGGRLAIRRDDFRIQRLIHRTGATVIFAVDASGSSALNRLNEAKGAVELLLAQSYVRRDRVALISFRGTRAELILSPTRSLARARRTLAGLPGGGGTPLAAGIAAGERLARQVAREKSGGGSLFVLLTDGRANIALDGSGGRPKAESDAAAAARSFRAAGVPSIVLDTSPRPSPFAAELARQMDARYLPLPVADGQQVSEVIRTVTQSLGTSR
jgi:magnesium chelatase subunit D